MKLSSELRAHLAKIGARGGKARARNLTKRRLSQIGYAAVRERERKRLKRNGNGSDK